MGAPLDLGTFAGAPPGSGANFAKLKGVLARRGAKDPGALAAAIGRRKYGKAGFAKLGHSHAMPSYDGINLADDESSDAHLHMHEHDGGSEPHNHPGFGQGRESSGARLANQRTARTVDLARRMPVSGPADILITRDPATGAAIVRNRQGGAEIARIRREAAGWVTQVAGKDLEPRNHQRTALMDAVGAWNSAARSPAPEAPAMPLQAPPAQTELMRQFGIPAVRALATPTASASDGGRFTAQGPGDDDDTDDDGLTDKGRGIRDRLKKKGHTHERATAFARRAQNTKAGQFGQKAG